MADRNTLGLGLARPTQQMACSSPEYSTGTSPLQAGAQHTARSTKSHVQSSTQTVL